MGKDYQRAPELSFAYGYGCCVFKHDIRRDQLEVPNCMPDSPGFISPKFFTSLRCLAVSASFKDAVAGVHHRKVAEELGRGAPPRDLNGTSTFSSSFYFFRNGPNMACDALTQHLVSGKRVTNLRTINLLTYIILNNYLENINLQKKIINTNI